MFSSIFEKKEDKGKNGGRSSSIVGGKSKIIVIYTRLIFYSFLSIGDNLNSSMLSEAQTKVATALIPALEDQDGFFEFFKEAAG